MAESNFYFSQYTFIYLEMFIVIIQLFVKILIYVEPFSLHNTRLKFLYSLTPALLLIEFFPLPCWLMFVFSCISMDTSSGLMSHCFQETPVFFFWISVHFSILAAFLDKFPLYSPFLGFKNLTSGGKKKF